MRFGIGKLLPVTREPGVGIYRHALLGRSDQAVVLLSSVIAYSRGFGAKLILRVPSSPAREGIDPVEAARRARSGDFSQWPARLSHQRALSNMLHGKPERNADGPTLEVAYSDGRTGHPIDVFADERPEIVVEAGMASDVTQVWFEPVPPPGDVTLKFSWPALGIHPTTTTLSGKRIAAAANKSTRDG